MSNKEKIEFGRQKYHGVKANGKKPKNGKLVCIIRGKEESILEDLPFAILNAKRSELIRKQEYFPHQLKLRYL